jgi:transcriptional regulator with XRE-family HTH domain
MDDKKSSIILSKNLEKLLKSYNLSSQKLALLSNIDHSIVKAILNGYHDPKLSTLILICQTLNITFDELLGDPNDYENYKEKLFHNYINKKISIPRKVMVHLFDEDKYPHL